MTSGKFDEKSKLQKRIRAKITNLNDPSSPYRSVDAFNELRTTPDDNIKTLADIPDYCYEHYADKETLGVREILDVQDEQQANNKIFKKFVLGQYHYSTFRQLYKRICDIGQGLLSIGAKPGDRILIFSETRSEWLLTAFSAFRHCLTVVTLYATLGEEALKHGINESEVSIIITSYELLSKLEKCLSQTPKVRCVIYFPPLAKSQEKKLPSNIENIQFIPLHQLEEIESAKRINKDLLNKRPDKTDIAVIMYTSGSTGIPKGVLIKHENIIAAMTGQKERVFSMINTETDIYVAYLPLAHILELCCEILMFFMGVKCGYSSPQTLTDQSTAIKRGQKGDLQVLRPHIMCCVPTILDRIRKTVHEKINQSNLIRRQLFDVSYRIKVKRLEEGLESPFLDKLIFNRLNQMVLGGRVKTMMCGGAVLTGETQRFVQAALCVTLFQGYGLTETCAAATIADQFDTSVGRAGHPLVSCEIRLDDWKEGNYNKTDKPNPRGEILIGGKVVAEGYFADAAKENENFKQINGVKYFCTGDIGEIYSDGTIKIIDRKKDLVKLRGGEYVSLTKVEAAVNKFSIVENCCLCASSSAEFTVILICPNLKEIAVYSQKHFGQSEWQNLIDDEDFNKKILDDVQDACKKGGIEKFETPQRVKVVTDLWTPDTGLVTDAFKLKRKAIDQKYKNDIENLYLEKSKKTTVKNNKKSRIFPE